MTENPNAEYMSRSRIVEAPPSAVFDLLTDPSRHKDTEPGDWVREAIDPKPITEVGQIFGMHMYLEARGGEYEMYNRVIELEPDRAIAWLPGLKADDGENHYGGWTWRYELSPADGDDRTEVTLTYDWSEVPPSIRDDIGKVPPFSAGFLEKSLASLAAAVEN